jgi:hypothetical protein
LYINPFKLCFTKCGSHISQINISLIAHFKQSTTSEINTKF